MVIAVTNNKGGVGKTTTAVHLAVALGNIGQKVLLIDIDGQASASMCLGLSREELSPSLVDVLFPDADTNQTTPIENVIRETGYKDVDLVTADKALYGLDFNLGGTDETFDVHGVLLDAIKNVRDKYDYIFFDCPPAFSLITMNAIIASDRYIIPITPDYLSAEGLQSLNELIDHIHERPGQIEKVLGIFVTKIDARSRFHKEMIGMLRDTFGNLVFTLNINAFEKTGLTSNPSDVLEI